MSQQLMDLIDRFGGAQAVEAMATRVGLSPEQAQSAMVALMPAVAGGMADTVATQGPAALDGAAAPAAEIAATDPADRDHRAGFAVLVHPRAPLCIESIGNLLRREPPTPIGASHGVDLLSFFKEANLRDGEPGV